MGWIRGTEISVKETTELLEHSMEQLEMSLREEFANERSVAR